MSESVDVSRACSFSSSIDVPAVLNRLEIQFLDVDESRAIVIFAGGILNVESLVGNLTALERAEITVYDLPLNHDGSGGTSAATELIDAFVSELSATAESS